MAPSSSLKTLLTWLGRVLLGGAFVWAAAVKIMEPPTFVADIGHYRLLPYPFAVTLGLYLPWLELLCGLAVITRRWEDGALLILVGLCTLFCLALASAWMRGLDIECGCIGHTVASTPVPLALLRSVVLGLIATFLLTSNRWEHSSEPACEGS